MSTTNIATKLNELIERVANLKRGSDLRHVTFDERGEMEARRIAERDRGDGRALEH